MKRFLIIILALAVGAGAATHYTAASGSRTDVATAITSATYGDSVLIPVQDSGVNIWTSGIAVTKDIFICGTGQATTCLTQNFTDNSVEEGFFNFTPDATARTRMNTKRGIGTFDVSKIHFTTTLRKTSKHCIYITNTNTPVADRIRIHNCLFYGAEKAVYSIGYLGGCFYEDTCINIGYVNKPEGPGFGAFDNNRIFPGSGHGWTYEDNLIINDNTAGVTFGACNSGGAYTVRYNDVTGTKTAGSAMFDTHGNQLAGIAGPQYSEVYGNNIPCTGFGELSAIRGGKNLYFCNIFVDHYPTLDLMEEYSDYWSSATLPTGKCYGDTFGIRQYCMDSCICQKVHDTYFFNNRESATGALKNGVKGSWDYDYSNNYTVNDPLELDSNVEYFNYRPLASFDGSHGVSIGTYAQMMAISPTVRGVGFWVTTQSATDLTGMVGRHPATPISGTLYRCTAPGVWTAWYTPTPYPDSLRLKSASIKVRKKATGTIAGRPL